MKYVVLLSDGMAGRPLEELNGRTTLEAAATPVMDCLSEVSELGMASMVPEGMAPGSDTANLAVMGYDPKVYYTGRSPLEALSIGVDMEETDVSFRCNIVTLSEEDCDYEDRTIIDHSSDGKHKREQGEQVDGEADHGHHGERTDNGDENGYRRNKRGLNILQKYIYHHDNQKYRFNKCPDNRIDGSIQELVGIGKHHEFRPFGQVPAEVVKHFVNLLDGA